MNKSILALSLGLISAIGASSVYATTGTINFEGRITANTCPIEVINPGDGSVGNLVKMGTLAASQFTGLGQEYSGKRFGLRVADGAACSLTSNEATVTFSGTADTSGDYFAVTPTQDGAKGIAIVLRDHTGSIVKPGAASAAYPLNDTGVTDMIFNAYYRSTAAAVTAGAASADVQFTVDII